MFSKNGKKLMLNLILILTLRLAAALYFIVSYNKNISFWPACLGICGKIKSFGVNIVSVFKTSENKPLWLFFFIIHGKHFHHTVVAFTQHFLSP